jgi:hypothetical protein
MSPRETYLGSGLFASWDGWQVKLRAPRDGADHVVYLEYGLTLEALLQFLDALPIKTLPEQFGVPPIKSFQPEREGNEMSAQNAETFVRRAKDVSDSDGAIKNLVKAVIQLCSAVKDLEAQVRMLKR